MYVCADAAHIKASQVTATRTGDLQDEIAGPMLLCRALRYEHRSFVVSLIS
jgi:hypothetical protein